jgi:hypothetical protein
MSTFKMLILFKVCRIVRLYTLQFMLTAWRWLYTKQQRTTKKAVGPAT